MDTKRFHAALETTPTIVRTYPPTPPKELTTPWITAHTHYALALSHAALTRAHHAHPLTTPVWVAHYLVQSPVKMGEIIGTSKTQSLLGQLRKKCRPSPISNIFPIDPLQHALAFAQDPRDSKFSWFTKHSLDPIWTHYTAMGGSLTAGDHVVALWQAYGPLICSSYAAGAGPLSTAPKDPVAVEVREGYKFLAHAVQVLSGLSQSAAAEVLNVSRESVKAWEKRK